MLSSVRGGAHPEGSGFAGVPTTSAVAVLTANAREHNREERTLTVSASEHNRESRPCGMNTTASVASTTVIPEASGRTLYFKNNQSVSVEPSAW